MLQKNTFIIFEAKMLTKTTQGTVSTEYKYVWFSILTKFNNLLLFYHKPLLLKI